MAALLVFTCAMPAAAQLRPLDPLDWTALTRPGFSVSLGAATLTRQRAALAGSRGRLDEFGNFVIAWTTGPVMLEGSGTPVRRYHEREQLEPAADDVADARGGVRQDAGAMEVATIVRLSPAAWPTLLALRFGTRLPNPNNRIGLDRDMTDFFALVGVRVPAGATAWFGEAGAGIHGTRLPHREQFDVLAYTAGAELRLAPATFTLVAVGHAGLGQLPIRGNEDLHELRFTARLDLGGTRPAHAPVRWIELGVIRGLAEFSPAWGVLVRAGMTGIAPATGAAP
jgi:hypothetical protein